MAEDFFSLIHARQAGMEPAREVLKANRTAERFGLMLTHQQALEVAENRDNALRTTGRVEFGEGILSDLIYTFCDSPQMDPGEYASLLCDLTEAFYTLKNSTEDTMTDEELLSWMRDCFDQCCGSVEKMMDRHVSALISGTAPGTKDDMKPESREDKHGPID